MNFIDFGIRVQGRGNVKTVCPKCSGQRKNSKDPCLSVNIDDGVWNCHHCGWTGHLGESKYTRPKYNYTKPKKYDWFENRGISKETVDHFKVSMANDWVGFPYYRGDVCCNIKRRNIKSKDFRQEKDAEHIFFNLPSVDGQDMVVVVEGEIDAMSIHEVGIKSVISVPNGAPNANDKSADGKLKCLDNCSQDLDNIKQFIIFVDNDDNGKRLEKELTRRLGAERCLVVDWNKIPDCKDANEVLVKYGQSELKMFIRMAKHCPIDGEHSFEEYGSLLDMERAGKPIYEIVDNGWRGFHHYKISPGYVTTITGVPSSGKSTFVANLAANLRLKHRWKFGMFCPENPGRSMLRKIVQAYAKKPLKDMTDEEYNDAKHFAYNGFYEIIGSDDSIPRTVENVLNIASVYVKRHGIKGLVIDAYSRLEKDFNRDTNETQFIGRMLDEVSRWAKKYETHVFIVAHPFKMEKNTDGQYKVVKPYDISGSSHWYNSSDMILSIYREKDNKATVHVQKVKEEPDFGELGKYTFEFNRDAGFYQEADYGIIN